MIRRMALRRSGSGMRLIQMGVKPSFDMRSSGSSLYDDVTGTPASCSISGARWGIVNGVVAQFASNVPPVEDKGIRGCPAFTQLAKMTETLTDAAWGKVNSTIVAHSSYQGSAIFKLIENVDTSSQHYIQQANVFGVPADNSVLGCCFVIKAGERTKVVIDIQDKNSAYSNIGTLDLSTGVLTQQASNQSTVQSLGNGFYRLFAWSNSGVGSTAPRFRLHTHNGSSTTYNGDGVSGILIGQPTYINFGVGGVPFIPPYVPNNTTSSVSVVSESATSTTGTSFDLDLSTLSRLKTGLRGPNAQGSLSAVVSFGVAGSWLANSSTVNIMSANNSAATFLKLEKDSGGVVKFTFTDGTNSASVTKSVLPYEEISLKCDWGIHSTGQKMRLSVNGVSSSLVTCNGSLGAEDLRFAFSSLVTQWIKKDSLKYYERPRW